jgi:hypothetical protein
MKKSEIYSKVIMVMVMWNEALDWEEDFPVLRQLFQDYETALSIEEWEAKNKESNPAPDTASTVLFTEAD